MFIALYWNHNIPFKPGSIVYRFDPCYIEFNNKLYRFFNSLQETFNNEKDLPPDKILAIIKLKILSDHEFIVQEVYDDLKISKLRLLL